MIDNLKPRCTAIVKVIDVNNTNIVMEDHKGFPLGESNLYCLSEMGELLWIAERPAPDAHYIRAKLETDGLRVSAYTTGRHAVDIDVKTGKLISQVAFR